MFFRIVLHLLFSDIYTQLPCFGGGCRKAGRYHKVITTKGSKLFRWM